MRFPVEIIHEIVSILSLPDQPLQFGHSPDVLNALCELALSSRLLRAISTPRLYSSIIISNSRTLTSFLRSPPTARSQCRTLWVRSFPAHMFGSVAELLLVLSPSIRRLALDIPGSLIDHSQPVRRALQACTRLEEFLRWGYSPMQVFPPPFTFYPDWKSLRRLVLDGPFIDRNFLCGIAQMPHLTHVALIEPRWRYGADGTEVPTFLGLLSAGRSLEKVFLIYCQPCDVYLNSLRRIENGVKTALRYGLDVTYTVMQQPTPVPMNAIRDRIARGCLWDLESKLLLTPLTEEEEMSHTSDQKKLHTQSKSLTQQCFAIMC